MSEIPGHLSSKLNHVLNIHDIDGDIRLYHREIGNGSQYAVRVFDGDSISFESRWYSESEMEIYLTAMNQIDRIAKATDD